MIRTTDITLLAAGLPHVGHLDARQDPRAAQTLHEALAVERGFARDRARARRQRALKAIAGGVARVRDSLAAAVQGSTARPAA